jgi:hypothetical protein
VTSWRVILVYGIVAFLVLVAIFLATPAPPIGHPDSAAQIQTLEFVWA